MKKKFCVNVHFDYMVTMDIVADDEYEARKMAEQLADSNDAKCVEVYDSCVVDEEDVDSFMVFVDWDKTDGNSKKRTEEYVEIPSQVKDCEVKDFLEKTYNCKVYSWELLQNPSIY